MPQYCDRVAQIEFGQHVFQFEIDKRAHGRVQQDEQADPQQVAVAEEIGETGEGIASCGYPGCLFRADPPAMQVFLLESLQVRDQRNDEQQQRGSEQDKVVNTQGGREKHRKQGPGNRADAGA